MMPLPATPVIVTLVSVLAVTGLQTYRLSETRRELAEERTVMAELRRSIAEANVKVLERTKEADDAARQDFDAEEADTAGTVDGVVDRINDLCLQYTTVERAYYRVSVPEAAVVVDDAPARAGDDRVAARAGRTAAPGRPAGNEFAAALGRDLKYCRTELNRLNRLQEWINGVSDATAVPPR